MTTWLDLGIDLPPNASGNVKCLCPQCSHERRHYRDKCLSVDVDQGIFRCHNCGWRGSLRQGEERRPLGQRPAPKVYRKPEPPTPTGLTPKAADFFRRRGIGLDVVTRHGITADDRAIHFPYTRGGELVNVKHRFPGKHFGMEAGCELIFYGLDRSAGAEQVVIVEGELDALACETAGLPHVLSVPNGAQTGEMSFLASGEPVFAHCHTIILAVDVDTPGLALEAELARRIGKEKCYRVRWPAGCKDANDVLLTHGSAALTQCIANAEPFPIEGIHRTTDTEADLMTLYTLGRQRGISTGWPALDHLYTVKPGQLTIVTGIPGSGKSEWLDALLLNLMKGDGWSFAVFSPENFPLALHLAKFAEKWAGAPFFDGAHQRMSEADARDFVAWAQDRLYFIAPDAPNLDDVLDRARALVFREGIRGLVIDPWNELDHTRPRELTETEYISRCLTRIRRFARDHDLHIWLVAHPRMLRREANGNVPIPTPYDISGSAHWFNKGDNCITVWRDKDHAEAPVQIHVQKIRFREIGQLGIAHLQYDRLTGNYRDIGQWEPAGGKAS